MSYAQMIALGEALLIVQAVALAAALALAVVAIIEARWWKRAALRRDPTLAGLEDRLPFLDGLLDRYRKEAA